jgi:uncharacterized protein (TIGR03084 family)
VEDVLTALAEQHDELMGLLSGLDESGWQTPSFCEGWDIADVVLHLAQTDEMAIGSVQGRFFEVLRSLADGLPPTTDVDAGVELMVARDRGGSGAAVLDRWQTNAAELRRVLATADPRARVTWVAGELTARTLATTRLSETWIHTGDVAFGLGVELKPTNRLFHIARLAWRTLPYAFARADRTLSGPVAFELVGPGGEQWMLVPDDAPVTVIRGDALDLCRVAGRRAGAAETGLRGEGPDVDDVLELVRTYA